METKLVSQAIKDVACDTLIVGALKAEKGQEDKKPTLFPLTKEVDDLLDGLLSSMYARGEFKGNVGETSQIYTLGRLAARLVIVVGLGAAEKLRSHTFRRASCSAVRFAQSKGARQIALALGEQERTASLARDLQAIVEGALLATYSFQKYRTEPNDGKGIASILCVSKDARSQEQQEALRQGIIAGEASNFVRDLVNEQPGVLTPSELARRAAEMAQRSGLECTVLERSQMEELGMGGLLGVARGSTEQPKFIILRYRGAPASAKTVALVGKGVTFDSGGLSLKTAAGMETMKGDMGGGAAVIGAMQIIAATRPAVNVLGLIPATENMPDGSSYRPGDILRMMNGKTIEILNTDAEGRLILADALAYAVKEGCSPIIDIATLTGACMVALGGKRAGLFSNDDELSNKLLAAGEFTGEKLWRLPLDDEYQDLIESQLADMKQTGGRYGGAITAAKLLEQFVDSTSWAHLDIAGMEIVESQQSFMGQGATGFGARILAAMF